MADENIEINSGKNKWLIPSGIVLAIVSSLFNAVNSCQSSNQATSTKITEVSTKLDQAQKDISEIKSDLKELNNKAIKDNEALNNRITVLEAKK